MKKDFKRLISELEYKEKILRDEMNVVSKKVSVLLEEKKELIKEDNQINQVSIEASRRLTCMSKSTFCDSIVEMENYFKKDTDFVNIGTEWFGYDIKANILIKDEEFINLLIISCGDNLIKKVFYGHLGLNKNIMKRFYYKISKKELINYIKNNYKDKFVTKANARTMIKED